MMLNKSQLGRVVSGELEKLQAHFSDKTLSFLLGVSGGADSIALLYVLWDILPSEQILVIHVNHGLSPNADHWQKFVAKTCDSLGVRCFTESVHIKGTSNIEEKARDARLNVYANYIQSSSRELEQPPILVLGHQRSDMAEHFLLRLMRAAGPKSLSGAQVFEQHFLGFTVWRPLINVGSQDVRTYLTEKDFEFVTDESNEDLTFSRNYVRHEVMPTLNRRWSDAENAIRQSQMWCKEASLLSDDIGKIDLGMLSVSMACGTITGLDILALGRLPSYRAKNVVRYWLGLQGLQQFRGALWDELSNALTQEMKPGHKLRLTVDFDRQLFLSIAYNALYLYQEFDLPIREAGAAQQGSEFFLKQIGVVISTEKQLVNLYPFTLQFTLPQNAVLQSRLADCAWRVVRAGEKMLCVGKPYSMTFKKLWQEWKVPLPLRQRWPVLVDDQDIVIFVPGVNIYGQSA